MTWENIIKRKKESFTRETDLQAQRRIERENNEYATRAEVARMRPSISDYFHKTFQYRELERLMNTIWNALTYFQEIYKRPEHQQILSETKTKMEELMDLLQELPRFIKDNDDDEELTDADFHEWENEYKKK